MVKRMNELYEDKRFAVRVSYMRTNDLPYGPCLWEACRRTHDMVSRVG